MTMKTIGMTAAVLGLALVLVGCSAPRGLQHKATRPITENLDAPQDDVTAAFAATAGNLKLGQTVSVNLPEGGVGRRRHAPRCVPRKKACGAMSRPGFDGDWR